MLTSPKSIKELLKQHQSRVKKLLGQSFLADQRALSKIVQAANLSPKDTVLEVGPGLGVLTQALAQKAKKVVAVEKDPAMVEILQATLAKEHPNLKIIQGDILSLVSPSFLKLGLAKEYKVVANLPYYITSPVIRLFLEKLEHKPALLVLMVQKEVAQRICAKPPHMNLLAVSVQLYGIPKIVSYIKRTSFWPQPKVDSAIIKIVPQNLASLSYPHLRQTKFWNVVRAGFKQPRKQLAGNLAKGLGKDKKEVEQWLLKNHINPAQRPETLSLEDWLNLARPSYSQT